MPSFYITAKKISALTPLTVDAFNRDEAIAMVVATAALGEEVQVSRCEEMGPGFEIPPVPTGTTGTTFGTFTPALAGPVEGPVGVPTGAPAGRWGGPAGEPVAEAKPNRAQLNEMSKDELLAVADRWGVDVNHSWNKADIVDAIVKHK